MSILRMFLWILTRTTTEVQDGDKVVTLGETTTLEASLRLADMAEVNAEKALLLEEAEAMAGVVSNQVKRKTRENVAVVAGETTLQEVATTGATMTRTWALLNQATVLAEDVVEAEEETEVIEMELQARAASNAVKMVTSHENARTQETTTAEAARDSVVVEVEETAEMAATEVPEHATTAIRKATCPETAQNQGRSETTETVAATRDSAVMTTTTVAMAVDEETRVAGTSTRILLDGVVTKETHRMAELQPSGEPITTPSKTTVAGTLKATPKSKLAKAPPVVETMEAGAATTDKARVTADGEKIK
jgi:hypothetical protein